MLIINPKSINFKKQKKEVELITPVVKKNWDAVNAKEAMERGKN